jgi:serine protease
MKRAFVAAIAVLIATALSAAETHRYLVATKRPFRAGALRAVRAGVDFDLEKRDVAGFESFAGFAASLTPAEADRLRASSDVRWVERVRAIHALEVVNAAGQTVPYGINSIGARAARTAHVPPAEVNVVVIDTGVDYRHPDLSGVWAGGWNYIKKTDDPMDDHGHGTHVAGTIAAADNGFGVLGVAPAVRLWGAKILDQRGGGTSEGLIAGIDWVVAQKKKLGGNWVINLSLGANSEAAGEREAFQKVADEGIVIVAAAGNSSTESEPGAVAFPGAYPSVIAVAAVNDKNKLASFSSQGPEVDFAAPGVGTLSALPVGSATIGFVSRGHDTFVNTAITGSKFGTATGEYVFCGLGGPGEFPSSVNGRIALIQRGTYKFADKARNAKEAGAIAVAIFNDEASESSTLWTMVKDTPNSTYEWPISVRMTKAAGEFLLQRDGGQITVAVTPFDYGEKSGTSMASPHVAGAVALLWSLAPAATPAQLVNALTTTAVDLGTPGADTKFGLGLINVYEAAKLLAPSAYGGISTGRPLGGRGGKG